MERNGEQQQENQHDDEVQPAPYQQELRFPRRIPPNRYPNAANPYLWPELSHITCHVCGYNGHYNLDCPYGERKCYRCGQGGHIGRQCRVREPRAQPAARQQENVQDESWDVAPIRQQDQQQEHQQEEPHEEPEYQQEEPHEEPEHQQEQPQQDDIIPVDLQCLMCFERRRCMVYIPCGHLCACMVCHCELEAHAEYDYEYGRTRLRCPVCRTLVVSSQQVFL